MWNVDELTAFNTHRLPMSDNNDADDLGESSQKILRDRLTPKGGFRNKWQRQRARRRAKHVGGHDANYK